MKMFLIRHGQSMQNTKENYTINLPDPKVYLTEKGKEEARLAGEFLKEYLKTKGISISNAVMWVSPYLRTRETAEIINSIIEVPKVKEDIALMEQQFGLFSNKEKETMRKMFPEQYELYNSFIQNGCKFYARIPQGESALDVALRTRQFLDRVEREKEDPLFIISHEATIKTIVMNIFHQNGIMTNYLLEIAPLD